ncbi:class I SAM-dependent methyltransferase [Trinickia violacea]|uniref:Class I SAM-dependent methyltransferase n=1 Tax=Trinickia violacea TaxID=2571746 RepID=A0A4P8IRV2_9BURK|nr:class I SAM-dependent methyltransferase [Trinickia violacea]QCP50767.1 class I SAM-dependent methyltransferase [Trinickia violacea]
MKCSVCGGESFTSKRVLWEELVNDWQLSQAEEAYVNRQQGESCNSCGANLRSIALANALRAALGTEAKLNEVPEFENMKGISILEINEAGNLTPVLRKFPGYLFGAYPEVDMHAIPYPDNAFDIVVHSDTLEHVQNPVHALRECRRVLKPGGALCYTVPTIVGRLTRNRQGLKNSYHGNPSTSGYDFVVQNEFGADAWTYLMEAGFDSVQIFAVEYPAATAFLARKS